MVTTDAFWESASSPATAAREVSVRVAREIISGQIPEGTFLTETRVAERFQLSRTPAREAMLQLETWGLVTMFPKKGAVVTAPSGHERTSLLRTRALFEVDAVEHIGRVPAGADDLAETLAQNLKLQAHAVADPDAFSPLDYSFHALIIDAGANSVIADVMHGLTPRFLRLTHLAVTSRPENVSHLHQEHEQLASLALAGDSTGYRALVDQHLIAGHGMTAGAS